MQTKKHFKFLLILSALLTVFPTWANVLIDPTRPTSKLRSILPEPEEVRHHNWTLESTLVAADRRVAVINGKLVSEGETVDGALIIKIRKLEVLIQTPSRRMTLQLLPSITKITTKNKD